MSGIEPGPPKDYVDEPDPDDWDPTGYYARKAEKAEEILPWLAGLFIASIVIVIVAFIESQREKLMTWIIIAFVAGAFVGWNVPQPAYAKRAQDWVASKFRT